MRSTAHEPGRILSPSVLLGLGVLLCAMGPMPGAAALTDAPAQAVLREAQVRSDDERRLLVEFAQSLSREQIKPSRPAPAAALPPRSALAGVRELAAGSRICLQRPPAGLSVLARFELIDLPPPLA